MFSLAVVVNLVTLPVEYNASRRATQILHQSGILTKEETQEAKEVLNSAALTYVAALVVSILNLLRLLLSVRSRD
jgi:Zn-dependent membrane protease YugP